MGCELRNRFGVLSALGDLDDDSMYNLKMTATSIPTKRNYEVARTAIGINLAHQRIIHRNTADIKVMTTCARALKYMELTKHVFVKPVQ